MSALLVGGVAAVVALAACSSGSGGDSPTATPSTSPSDTATAEPFPSPTFTGAYADFCNDFIRIAEAGEKVADAVNSGDTAAQQKAQESVDSLLSQFTSSLPADAPQDVQDAMKEFSESVESQAKDAAAKREAAIDSLGSYAGEVCPVPGASGSSS